MFVIRRAELEYQLSIRGWDQKQLAISAGVSEATISRVVAGRRLRGLTALKIAQALRRSPPVSELSGLVQKSAIEAA